MRDVVWAWLLVARQYLRAARALAQAASGVHGEGASAVACGTAQRPHGTGQTVSTSFTGRLRTDPPGPAGHKKSPAA